MKKNFCKAIDYPLCTADTEEKQRKCLFAQIVTEPLTKKSVCKSLDAGAKCNNADATHKIAPYTLKEFLRNKPFREKIVFEGEDYQILGVDIRENKCLVYTRFRTPPSVCGKVFLPEVHVS